MSSQLGQSSSRHDPRSINSDVDARTTVLEMTEPPAGLTNVAMREDMPPDGGYGWVCTACVFMINAHTWGINGVSVAKRKPVTADRKRHGESSYHTTLIIRYFRAQHASNMR